MMLYTASIRLAIAVRWIDVSGRGERIRTSDHMHPMHVRYQAALRPEGADYSRGGTVNDNPLPQSKPDCAWINVYGR